MAAINPSTRKLRLRPVTSCSLLLRNCAGMLGSIFFSSLFFSFFLKDSYSSFLMDARVSTISIARKRLRRIFWFEDKRKGSSLIGPMFRINCVSWTYDEKVFTDQSMVPFESRFYFGLYSDRNGVPIRWTLFQFRLIEHVIAGICIIG